MANPWVGVVNAIIYSVQFEELDDAVADRIAQALLTEPYATYTPEEEFNALAEGIRNGYPLPDAITTKHKSEDLRKFISSIVRRMDSARPWPELPYRRLPADGLQEFLTASRPVARIHAPYPVIEPAIKLNFNRNEELGEFLLVRMRSGIEVAFFAYYWEGSHDTLLAAAAGPVPAHEIVAELVASTDLQATDFSLVMWPEPPPEEAPLYETTPLHVEFHGEHLPGNRQWGSSVVRYLAPEERPAFQLFANNGLLYTSEQTPLDTRYASTLWTPQGGRAIFVMDEYGRIYASPYHLLGEFHHSSFLAGGAVAAAGEISAVQGQVQLISDHSTHYRPARRFTHQAVDSLLRQGISFDEQAVEYHYPE